MPPHRLIWGMGIAASMLGPSIAAGQTAPVPDSGFPLDLDSGWLSPAATDGLQVLFSEVVTVPNASWLRLRFGDVALPGSSGADNAAYLRITSWKDGAEQTLYADHLAQWRNTSAYFNGDTVIVELLAHAGALPARVQLAEVIAGDVEPIEERTICGETDDRELSTDPRIGRTMPGGCTAWLIDDEYHSFLSAGHCAVVPTDVQVVEFNVPLSTSTGLIQHPPPQDQYAVDPASLQIVSGSIVIGNDWAYFGAFPNSITALTPFQAQQACFTTNRTPQPTAGTSMRVTGYGTVFSTQGPRTWNQVQKTHAGPLTSFTGQTLRYQADTTGGNSGSPIIDETDGRAIGIHTNGGCVASGGSNSGTSLAHSGLHDALANPRGVSAGPVLGEQTELARLIPPQRQTDDQFGAAVALSGTRAVVGAPAAAAARGAAYIFEEGSGAWDIVAALPLPPGIGTGHYFGQDVAIDGDRLVVSAPGNALTSTVAQVSRVHVYERAGTTWTHAATLSPSAQPLDDWYGLTVDLEGDWLAVGAPRDSTGRGAVYVYRFTGAQWSLVETLRGPDAAARQFGYDVDLDGGRLIVGARNEAVGTARPGAAYIYQWNGAAWTQQAHFIPPLGATGDQFGAAVALRGDTAVIGAPFADDAIANSGSLHPYRYDGVAWRSQPLLTAPGAAIGDATGGAVALAENVVLAGSPGNDGRGNIAGAIYRFVNEEGQWSNGVPAVVASDTVANDQFGCAIDVDGRLMIIGARLKAGGGAAYIFPVQPCPADRNSDARADVHDLLHYLDSWFAGGDDADVNDDEAIDVEDLLIYLDLWFAGCE